MRRKINIAVFTSLLLFSFLQLTLTVSAQQKLTLAMILTGLQTRGTNPETSTLAKRNIYIAKRVETNGVTFRLTTEIEQELRNAGATPTLIATIRTNGPTPVTTTTTNTKPSALYKDLWVDYGITEGGQLGMRIHVKFTTYQMKNINSYLAIYFQQEDGTSLKDKNGKFASTSGDVAVYREFTPIYDSADFNDVTTFMPYAELDLPDGNWNLQMDAKLIYKAGGLIQNLAKKPFNYKKGDSVDRDPDSVSVKVNRTWIDYNVTESGQKGMRIHVNFEVTGLKGVSAFVVARVQKSNGDYLLSSGGDYSNEDGQLETTFSMKPGFETTVYKDADLFLPYTAIRISKGVWNLKLDIDLNYEDGDLIKHLAFEEFQFTQP